MKQKDFIFTMMALLLVVVVLLLVSPSICGCSNGGNNAGGTGGGNAIFSIHRIIFGPGPVHLNPMPTSTVVATTTMATTTPSLSPQSGPVGTVVTIHGSGFNSDNTIEMNGLVAGSMKDVASADGKTLSFTVPSTLGPNCKPNEMCAQFLLEVSPNVYKVSVVTNGMTQDVGTFTVVAAQ